MRPEAIVDLKVVKPTEPILTAFQKFARPFFEEAAHNRIQQKTLAALRDMLLPALVSGELSPPLAKTLVERDE